MLFFVKGISLKREYDEKCKDRARIEQAVGTTA